MLALQPIALAFGALLLFCAMFTKGAGGEGNDLVRPLFTGAVVCFGIAGAIQLIQ